MNLFIYTSRSGMAATTLVVAMMASSVAALHLLMSSTQLSEQVAAPLKPTAVQSGTHAAVTMLRDHAQPALIAPSASPCFPLQQGSVTVACEDRSLDDHAAAVGPGQLIRAQHPAGTCESFCSGSARVLWSCRQKDSLVVLLNTVVVHTSCTMV